MCSQCRSELQERLAADGYMRGGGGVSVTRARMVTHQRREFPAPARMALAHRRRPCYLCLPIKFLNAGRIEELGHTLEDPMNITVDAQYARRGRTLAAIPQLPVGRGQISTLALARVQEVVARSEVAGQFARQGNEIETTRDTLMAEIDKATTLP